MPYCHNPAAPESCELCRRYGTEPDFRAAMDAVPVANGKPASRSLLGPKPCRFRGAPTGATEECPTCTGRVSVPVLECAVKGRCTLNKLIPGIECCKICTARVEPDPDPVQVDGPEILPGLRDPLGGAETWPPTVEFRRATVSRDHHLTALRQVVNEYRPPKPPTPTRGIVWVGGGKFWPGIATGIKLLREIGCTLPVEVWYRGSCEAVNPADVAGLGVSLIDSDREAAALLDNRVAPGQVERGGWESKLYALTHTQFEQVLFLDGDAYCVADPTPLFDLLSPAEPFVFWSDLPGLERNVKWPHVWPEGWTGPTVQGGQLVIDRRHAARLLGVCHWMNQHSDYYYAHMFGDQDAWRVGLAAGLCGYRHLGPAPWRNVAFVCGYQGTDYVVHRCQGKLYRHSDIPPDGTRYSNPDYSLPREARVFDLFAETLRGERDSSKVFPEIYAKRLWNTGGSGAGSLGDEAREYVERVHSLAFKKGWRSAVDAGCGDGLIGSALAFPDYVGVDVCPDLIAKHRVEFPDRNWVVADAFRDLEQLPAADVLLCKDVLHHWPSDMISDWLTRVQFSRKWKAVLLTQDTNQQHDKQDCHLGGYRALNPDLDPLRPFGLSTAFTYLHKAGLIWECSGSLPG